MTYEFTTKGVCARGIVFEVEGDVIKEVRFIGGCSGNTQGVAALAQGMNVQEYIKRCKDIKCGTKSTSCPAQLAIALEQAMAQG